MQKFIYLSILFLTALNCRAEKFTQDSIGSDDYLDTSVELSTVTVEATLQNVKSNVATFYPDTNVKRAAQSATDMLRRMAIPQITVETNGSSVSTISGQNVAIFIDYQPATQIDIDALKPTDVRKVEYIVFPADPRFGGNKYVVNFTLRNRELGGYSKYMINGNMTWTIGGMAYLKATTKKWSIDLAVSDQYSNRSHFGYDMNETFRPIVNDQVKEISRVTTLSKSHSKSNGFGSSLRLLYNTDKLSFSNRFTFSNNNTPVSSSNGKVTISDGDQYTGYFFNSSSSVGNSVAWNGRLYVNLSNDFYLNFTPSINYSHNNYQSTYTADELTITNDAVESYWELDFRANLQKLMGKHHSLNLELIGVHERDKIDYTGTSNGMPKYNLNAFGSTLTYTFKTNGLYLNLMGGFVGERNTVASHKAKSFVPTGNFFSQYNINEKQSIGLNVAYSVLSIDPSLKNSIIIRSNEFLYQTGNPELKLSKNLYSEFQYTNLINNTFSVSAFINLNRNMDATKPQYEPMDGKEAILKGVIQDGDYQLFSIGTSLTGRFFKRTLSLKVSPAFRTALITGLYHNHKNYFTLSASANYYFGNFYASANYSPAYTYIPSGYSSNLLKQYSIYGVGLGWSKSNLNISINCSNFFRSSWISAEGKFNSEYYDRAYTSYSSSYHRNVSLRISYLFDFGRKVKQNDEINTNISSSSAIMK